MLRIVTISATLPRRSILLVTLLAALALPACVGYQPGSFRSTKDGSWTGRQYTIGCLDVAVAPYEEPLAFGPVAEIRFGNRCQDATTVDLSSIQATARFADGHAEPLTVFDPSAEIRRGRLDAGAVGREVLEYQTQRLLGAATQPSEMLTALCLDIGRIDAEEPSPRPVVACMSISQSASE